MGVGATLTSKRLGERAHQERGEDRHDAQGHELAGATGPLSLLDCDIIIDEAPDSLTPQIEQFQALVELKKYDRMGEIPFSAIMRAMPNLTDKQAFLKDMEQQQAQAAQRAQSAQPQGQPPALHQLQLRSRWRSLRRRRARWR